MLTVYLLSQNLYWVDGKQQLLHVHQQVIMKIPDPMIGDLEEVYSATICDKGTFITLN